MLFFEPARDGFHLSQIIVRRGTTTESSSRLLSLEFAVGALLALPQDKGRQHDERDGANSDDANDGAEAGGV